MLTREEFAEYFNSLKEGLGNADSPLWCAEDSVPCEWFVCSRPLKVSSFKAEYWKWCTDNLIGYVRCYSSDSENQQEWWGFSDKQDIVLWTLKWT